MSGRTTKPGCTTRWLDTAGRGVRTSDPVDSGLTPLRQAGGLPEDLGAHELVVYDRYGNLEVTVYLDSEEDKPAWLLGTRRARNRPSCSRGASRFGGLSVLALLLLEGF